MGFEWGLLVGVLVSTLMLVFVGVWDEVGHQGCRYLVTVPHHVGSFTCGDRP